jgi:hypothetical protein
VEVYVRRCFASLEIAMIAMSPRDKVVAGSKIATDWWLALILRLLIAIAHKINVLVASMMDA